MKKKSKPLWLSNENRDSQYAEQQGIFMVHKIVGTTNNEGREVYRIRVYLSANPRRNSLDQVVEARFFLGRAFKYEMITRTKDSESPKQAKLMPSEFFCFEAQAESECLCLGEVTLKDGTVIKLVSRWLDLETVPLLAAKQELDAFKQEKSKEDTPDPEQVLAEFVKEYVKPENLLLSAQLSSRQPNTIEAFLDGNTVRRNLPKGEFKGLTVSYIPPARKFPTQ
ncbi:MAG: hypothetical protein K2X81_26365 [Candidatus Obscuribacterales bacterium]|nr:hypothetical protein [Candidatus Obscuribacterales bacterium]